MASVTCPHGEACGACAYLGTGYETQLARKRDALGRALSVHRALRGATLLKTLPSPLVSGYRNRAKMAVGLSRKKAPLVGYFRERSREIVDAPECRVLVPELLETTRRFRAFLSATPSFPREIRHIDARAGSDPSRQHLTLVFRAEECPSFPLDPLRRALPSVDGISVHLNPSAGPQVIRGVVQHVWGEREVWVHHRDLRLRVSPSAFFQVNLTLLLPIHERLERFFGEGEMLVDLYAGVGTHGLSLRKSFRRVVLVEGTRSAAADAKATVRSHGLRDVEVIASSVERALRRLEALSPDALLLNPSRAGATQSVLRAIAASGARKVAYLSCEPETLTRDLSLLARLGFDVASVQPIDMMPQTRQVEALALLERRRHRSSG
jgi:23S rRNA (uracil1939-C5)-methyltransferase